VFFARHKGEWHNPRSRSHISFEREFAYEKAILKHLFRDHLLGSKDPYGYGEIEAAPYFRDISRGEVHGETRVGHLESCIRECSADSVFAFVYFFAGEANNSEYRKTTICDVYFDGNKLDLYYWSRNRDEGSAEVDFCLQYGSRLTGIEIKSGNSSDMKSLFSLINSGSNVIPVRVSWDNLMIGKYEYAGKKYRILSLPFYLIDRWQDLIAQFIAEQEKHLVLD
jgi:hypothetical protein